MPPRSGSDSPARTALRTTAALSALVLAVALAACEQTTATTDDHPVAGGTLRVTVRDLATLDPAKASGRGAQFVLAQVFDSLTSIDELGRAVPAAAASWDTSPDGLTWTFHLADSRFHDGAPVTAWDFKFAFDRLAAKVTGSDTAFQLEMVSGFKAAKVDGTTTSLAGVKVVNQTTLAISLDRSFSDLPLFLAHPSLGPISQKVFNKDPATFVATPVGNGPFKVSSARTPTGVELSRFDTYTGGAAYLDGVQVEVSADADTGWKGWLAGRNDVVEVPTAAIERDRAKYGPEGFTPFWAAVYYGPNLKMPKFGNPDFRRAISLAIDRVAIARTVYGGTKSAATGLIPKGIAGFADVNCDACKHDVSQARALIAKVFGSAPPEVILDHLDASPSRDVATAIAGNLRDAGLRVALRAHTSAEYLRTLQEGKQELAELGWLAQVPSPDGFLSQQLRTGSPNNQTGFSDPTFDSLTDRARAARDDQQRTAAYKDAEARALTLMPLIPIVFFRNHLAVARRVHGFRLDGAGLFDAAKTWISPAA